MSICWPKVPPSVSPTGILNYLLIQCDNTRMRQMLDFDLQRPYPSPDDITVQHYQCRLAQVYCLRSPKILWRHVYRFWTPNISVGRQNVYWDVWHKPLSTKLSFKRSRFEEMSAVYQRTTLNTYWGTQNTFWTIISNNISANIIRTQSYSTSEQLNEKISTLVVEFVG